MEISFEKGGLGRIFRDEARVMGRAVPAAINRGTTELKEDLRADVRKAGLGNRLPRTWRSKFYRNQGINAAGVVFSKAPHIVQAFEEGKPIRAQGRRWLAVPTDRAPKQGIGRKRISPETWPEHRFGPLAFVKVNRNLAVLVATGLRRSRSKKPRLNRKFRRLTARQLERGRRGRTAIMFILTREVRLKKRLNVDREGREALESLGVKILEESRER